MRRPPAVPWPKTQPGEAMTDIAELERRVAALEAAQNDTTQTQRWVVAKLGRMSAVQDEHTLHLERIEGDVTEIKQDISELKRDVSELKLDVLELKQGMAGLRKDLPAIVSESLREVLKERRDG